MTSPTSRSIEHLKKLGYTPAIVEHWNMFAHVRQDLFGCIDILAIKGSEKGVWGIQATSDVNITHRVNKSLKLPVLKTWLEAGNRFTVWGWGKKGGIGKRKLWTLREREITLSDF